jgi:hypothetical protein
LCAPWLRASMPHAAHIRRPQDVSTCVVRRPPRFVVARPRARVRSEGSDPASLVAVEAGGHHSVRSRCGRGSRTPLRTSSRRVGADGPCQYDTTRRR